MNSEFFSKYSPVYLPIFAVGEILILWIAIIAKVFSFNRFIGNELDVLPSARQFFAHGWLPNDWYLNLDIGYRQVFNYSIGFLVDWVGFLNGAYLGRLIGYLFLAIAFFVLFRSLSLRFSLGLIVVLLFLGNQSLVAGEWMVGGADTKTLSYAFALLSFALFYKKKYLIGFALAGAALSFHVLIGIYALFCVIVAILLTNGSMKEKSVALIRHSWPLFITGIFGFLAILQQIIPQEGINANKAWRIYVEFRVPHHLLPSAWPGNLWIIELILATCLFILIYFLIKKAPLKFTAAYGLGSVCLFIFGLVVYSIGQVSFLRFYWFRYPDVMIPFLSALLVALLLNELTSIDFSKHPGNEKLNNIVRTLFRIGLPILFALVAILLTVQSIRFLQGKYQRGLNRKITNTQVALEWVSENTPEEAVFLIDPLLNEFYIYANRARFVSFSHPPQSAAEILEWYGRLTLINGNQEPSIPPNRGEMQENYSNLEAGLIQDLVDEFGVSYYLGQPGKQLPFLLVYQDDNFALYDISSKGE
jgi:hypothetical protein